MDVIVIKDSSGSFFILSKGVLLETMIEPVLKTTANTFNAESLAKKLAALRTEHGELKITYIG